MLRLIALIWILPLPIQAIEFSMPVGLEKIAQYDSPLDTLLLPLDIWDGSKVPSKKFMGASTKVIFRSDVVTKPEAIAAVILPQLIEKGYKLTLQCADRYCGGFDFRFSLKVMSPPEMYVDLGNYIFIGFQKDDDKAAWLLISQSLKQTHMQLTTIQPTQNKDLKFSVLPVPKGPGELSILLSETGHFILADLKFEAGAAKLEGDVFPSLLALVEYLRSRPTQSVVLVGHTDSQGSLETNIELSKERAISVQALLNTQFPDIEPGRINANGIGYLAPVASNQTNIGRELNRRVEVVLIPVE